MKFATTILFVFILLVLASSASATDTNYTGQPGDGELQCLNDVSEYPDYACTGGSTLSALTAGTTVRIGQNFSSGNFRRFRTFFAFDTSAVSSATAAQLYFVFTGDSSTTDFSVLVYSGNGSACWSTTNNALTTADWNASITPETGTTFNSSNYPGNNVGFWWTITSTSVNADGNTDFKLMSLRDEQNTEPSGNEWVNIATQNNATAGYRPLLQITETVIPEYGTLVFVVVLVSSIAIAFAIAKKK